MPAAKVGEVNLFEVCSTKCRIGWPGDHGAHGIIGVKRNLARRGDLVNIVRGVTGDEQISSGIEGGAVRHAMQIACVDATASEGAIALEREGEHIVARALNDEEGALIGAESHSVGKRKGTGKALDASAGTKHEEPSVIAHPLTGVREVKVAFGIEDGKVGSAKTIGIDAIP